MRCFIAVDVKNPLIGPFIDELSEVGAALRTVKPENVHLTLKFLGDVPDDSINAVRGAMVASLSTFEAFEASLEGVGAFPSANYMRVVWIGIKENSERFIGMQKAVDEKLAVLGFERDKKFHPHLTLARVKSQKGKGKLKAFINKNKERSFGKLKVNKVELKKSVLSPMGPVYSTVEEVKLGGS